LPVEDDGVFETPSEEPVEARMIVRERDDTLRRAFAKISERCQTLLRLLSAPEPPSYEEISGALAMPVGAIGPTRARCLDKLRRVLEITETEVG
jgi:DNA-directed RNA polymerase specialized sigma24 family protein